MNGENKLKNSGLYNYRVVIVVRIILDNRDGCYKEHLLSFRSNNTKSKFPNAFYITAMVSVEMMT